MVMCSDPVMRAPASGLLETLGNSLMGPGGQLSPSAAEPILVRGFLLRGHALGGRHAAPRLRR